MYCHGYAINNSICRNVYIFTITVSMATKPAKVAIYDGDQKFFDHVVLWNHVTNQERYISTTRVAIDTKLCRLGTDFHGLRSIKSHEHFTAWSYEIRWQAQIISAHG